MFVLAFTAYCDKSGINNIMAKWCLSRRVFAGHPWIFTASVLTGTLIIGFLVDGVPAAFLIAGILYSMFHDIDMKQGDDYPAYLLAGVYMAGVLSFACKPWAGQNLMGISALSDVSGGAAVINNITLIVRFIFRPDIARLSHLTPEYLDRISSQIHIDNKQRVAATALVVFLLVMFLPNILPAGSAAAKFFGKFNMVVAMVVILGVLSFLRVDGEPVFDFHDCASGINWNVIWMLAASMPVSAALSSDGAGLSRVLTDILSSFVGDGNILIFLAGFMIFINIMTQFTHNVTIVLIAVPLIWNLSQSTGINPSGFTVLMLLAAGAAYATPAASTVGALSFANGAWVGMRRAFKAGIFGCVAAIICMLGLGLPLVMVTVGL